MSDADINYIMAGTRVRVERTMPEGQDPGRMRDTIGMEGAYIRYDANDATLRHLVDVDGKGHVWVNHVTPVDATPEATPETFTPEQVAARVAEAVREARQETRAALSREFESWKQTATEVAHRYADENSLCREFDRCMLEIGLEPRDSYRRDWEVTLTLTVTVEATDEDEAEESAKESARSILSGYSYADDLEIDVREA
jgi:hypothetical protein